jgi:MarR family transcriptional regulator, transcriptional regulator for hemolysin
MNNFEALFETIGVLARRRYMAAERQFAVLSLNHTEARLLNLLHRERGIASQEALSSQLYIDRSNTGRALKHLEQEGYTSRQPDDTDKRANLVRITEKGRKAVREISSLKRKIVQEFFGEFNEAEAGIVVDLLGKLVAEQERGSTERLGPIE